jgi:large subunit ribosomal protein L23
VTLHVADVLRRPVITEKNTTLTPLGQYTFEVAPEANKIMVKQAVEQIFNVKVKAVNILIVKPKKRRVMRSRNFRKTGTVSGYKKAIVSLEPGYTIDIFGDI